MGNPVNDSYQPILGSIQNVGLTTASATVSSTLPACGAVRVQAGVAPLYFSFTGSASAGAGTGSIFLSANQSVILQTAGSHTISFRSDTSANPMIAGVTPLV